MTVRLIMALSAVVVAGLPMPGLANSNAPAADPALNALPAIVVSARESPVHSAIDRKIYSIATDLQSVAGTAADVLNQIPSVDVDADGNVSLRGDIKVTILIDGKPSALLSGSAAGDGLLQFAAADIEKIEVMTNPPPQFKAEGTAGVINIITKKTHPAGPSGTLRASLGNEQRSVLGGSGHFNAGAVKFSGGFGLREDRRERIIDSTLVAADPSTHTPVLSHENLRESLRRALPSLNAGMDYGINEHQSLAVSLSYRERNGNRFYDQHDASGLTNGSSSAISARHGDGHARGVNSDQTVRFTQILRQPDETLGLSLHRTTALDRENYAFLNTYTLPVAASRFEGLAVDADLATTEVSADYAIALSQERRLTGGYDFEEDKNAFNDTRDNDPSSTSPRMNPLVTHGFRYRQNVHAAYLNYQRQAAVWDLQAGVRVERSAIDTRQITGGLTSGQHYTRLYPTLHLERSLSAESSLSLSFSRRVSRPSAQELNPFYDRQSTHNIRSGNPSLAPQDTQSFEVGYSRAANKREYDFTGYVRRNRNSVTDVTQLLSADVVLTTKANLAKSTSAGVEFTANGRLSPSLSYDVSGNLAYNQIDATALGASGLRSSTGLNAKASLDYKLTARDMAQIGLSRVDKRLSAQGYLSAINLVNVGYRRRLTHDLSAVLTVTDLLNGQRTQRFASTPVLVDTYQRIQIGRIVYVGVVYVLGHSKKNNPNGFDFDE